MEIDDACRGTTELGGEDMETSRGATDGINDGGNTGTFESRLAIVGEKVRVADGATLEITGIGEGTNELLIVVGEYDGG